MFLVLATRFVVVVVNENTATDMLCHKCAMLCVLLLLIVVLAVQQAVPAVTGPGQRT